MISTVSCLEWAMAGRPLPGEAVSGDLALALRTGDDVLLAVIDGLGHGVLAAEAAGRARDTLKDHVGEALHELLDACHVALQRTRGVTMTLAAVDCGRGLLHWTGVGNVEARLVRTEGAQSRMVDSALLHGGTLGYRLPQVRVRTVELEGDELLVMATDGIAADFTSDLAAAAPVDQVVTDILDRHGRSNDDALVVAARQRGWP
jgi:phosphoserine phosphatase RsbX